ncbi:prepilin-type N-terminal cleavage/methylation domain-containing protein [Paenibacillus hexagrammi]|uniref:Prepilin-type N-terminal cleavage/methylation domain-containing protein n=1 Tax=Paenibacillus hexagrammi TaxID=2908839 RepID=A0ABY3SQY6_9BACL|nr:prepilin-type N-terminal cleavage/methylation domain-containing protein [Paenibacillus sp. YPD9-1]UJF35975.1 prepilin-type N-terminal cleavage/methylation domain-containing protein [Paenibacillus sp. YPD9-1]
MKQILKKINKDEKGFTLIELLAVIVILAIIAAIAVPLINGIIQRSRNNADIATARQISEAARLFLTSENHADFVFETVPIHGTAGVAYAPGTNTAALSADDAEDGLGLMTGGYLQNNITMPSVNNVITGGQVNFDANGTLTSVVIQTGTGGAGSGQTWTFSADVISAGTGAVTPVNR